MLKVNRSFVSRYLDTFKGWYRYRVVARYFNIDTIWSALLQTQCHNSRFGDILATVENTISDDVNFPCPTRSPSTSVDTASRASSCTPPAPPFEPCCSICRRAAMMESEILGASSGNTFLSTLCRHSNSRFSSLSQNIVTAFDRLFYTTLATYRTQLMLVNRVSPVALRRAATGGRCTGPGRRSTGCGTATWPTTRSQRTQTPQQPPHPIRPTVTTGTTPQHPPHGSQQSTRSQRTQTPQHPPTPHRPVTTGTTPHGSQQSTRSQQTQTPQQPLHPTPPTVTTGATPQHPPAHGSQQSTWSQRGAHPSSPPTPHGPQSRRAQPPSTPQPTAHSRAYGHNRAQAPNTPPTPYRPQSQRAQPPSTPPAHGSQQSIWSQQGANTQHPPHPIPPTVTTGTTPQHPPPPTAHSRAYGRIRHQYFYLCINVMLFTLNAGIFSRWASQLKATCIFGDYGHNVALVIFSDTTYITLALSGFASNGQRHRLAYYV